MATARPYWRDRMPYTKCPSCRKVQQVVPGLLSKDIGCMNAHCGQMFRAHEYILHSGPWSRAVFFGVIAFALLLLFKWIWDHAYWIVNTLG